MFQNIPKISYKMDFNEHLIRDIGYNLEKKHGCLYIEWSLYFQ